MTASDPTTPEALVTIRAYLAEKKMLSPDIRDALEQLLAAVEGAQTVIKPFAATVFNDNGDVTVTTSRLEVHDYFVAYKWQRKHGADR